MSDSTTLVYVVTGIVVLVGVLALISWAIKNGKKPDLPPTAHMETYDQVLEEQQQAEDK